MDAVHTSWRESSGFGGCLCRFLRKGADGVVVVNNGSLVHFDVREFPVRNYFDLVMIEWF